MNILLVEDDPKLGRLIQFKLNKEGFRVEWVLDADEAELFIQRETFDIFLFDWMMPQKTGVKLCKELRAARNLTPILILTAKDAVSDRVIGLNAGADDYLVKPFAFEELIARLQALHRRRETNWNRELLDLGETLQIRKSTMEVVRSGRKKVDDPFQYKMIQSVRGMGYRMTVKEPQHV